MKRIRKHFEDNRNTYIASAATAVTVSAAFLVLNRSNAELKNLQQIRQISWRPQNTQVIISFVERSTPSKPVHLVGTDLYFDSLSDAAKKTGYSLSAISKVVNGHRTDINGDVFELLKPA